MKTNSLGLTGEKLTHTRKSVELVEGPAHAGVNVHVKQGDIREGIARDVVQSVARTVQVVSRRALVSVGLTCCLTSCTLIVLLWYVVTIS